MSKTKRKIRIAALLLLVCIAVGSISSASFSYALTGGYMCGYTEEHTHTKACFKNVLVCGKEEHVPLCGKEEHLHDMSCLREQKTLVCDMPEHAHTQTCYDAGGMLCCNMVEHVHTDTCYHVEYVLGCGKEEHSHTDACIPRDENGNPYEIHVHTASCWQNKCVCGKKEHKHDPVLCMFASFEDVENEAVWENSLPLNSLTGDWNHDILLIAASQVGYTESYKNTVLAEDGKTRLGYTRYGHWFGYPYGDWCAMFSAFCMNYAGVPRAAIPTAAGVETWMQTLEKKGMLETPTFYVPKPGDLVFISDDGVTTNHMGIVSSFTSLDELNGTNTYNGVASGVLQIIQGNKEDAVKVIEIEIPHWSVTGYVDVAKASDNWNGVNSFEIRCGDDLLELRYQQNEKMEALEGLVAERRFASDECFEQVQMYVLKYLEKLNIDVENIRIKIYELESSNASAASVLKPDSVNFLSGASGTPMVTSFELNGKTYIALCR